MAYKCESCGGWISESSDMNNFAPPCSCKKINWQAEAERLEVALKVYQRVGDDMTALAEDRRLKLVTMTALAEKYKVCGNCYHYRGDMCYYDLDRVLVDRKEKCDNWRFDEEV